MLLFLRPLDVLIISAGKAAEFHNEEITKDGLEKYFAIHYLSQFYLINLLLNKLRESAPSRLVVVSSNLHKKTGVLFFFVL